VACVAVSRSSRRPRVLGAVRVVHIDVVLSQPLALAGLVLVGVVLAVAYERTGSLVVPSSSMRCTTRDDRRGRRHRRLDPRCGAAVPHRSSVLLRWFA
jgi:hypothetical protein